MTSPLAALLALAMAVPATASAAPLSMQGAIGRALDTHVRLRLARAGEEESRGKVLAAAAGLLPALTGTVSQERVFRFNLAALGFGGEGSAFPSLIGPYNVFDARVRLALNVLDAPAWMRWSQARASSRAALAEEELASEQVAGAAALAYIEALRARRAIAAAEAGVKLASELVQLARDRKAAGTAMGLDLARAESREADEKLRLLDARTQASEADLLLERVAGLPLGEAVELSEALVPRSTEAATTAGSTAADAAGRPELSVARERLAASGLELKAARLDHLPRVAVAGDVGLSGNEPNREARTTGSIGAFLTLPLFDWRLAGRVKESRAARDAAQARFDDLLREVDEDARRAVNRLAEAAERVTTSEKAAGLAHAELELARGRFEDGVGDNLELVSAQTSLARAEDRLAGALAAYQVARVNRALAEGRMRGFVY
jgi:outer membrane protein TolC